MRGTRKAAHRRKTNTFPPTLPMPWRILKKTLSKEDLQAIQASDDEDMAAYHFGLGMGLRNAWGIWGDSRLSKHFNSLGISHPDDMSSIILTSLWRELHRQPVRLEEQVAYYRDYWKRNARFRWSEVDMTTVPTFHDFPRGL